MTGPTCRCLPFYRILSRVRFFLPLAAFLVPTAIVGFGFVIPRSCIAGVNEQSVGFALSLVGASIAYWQGVRFALHRCEEKDRSRDAAS